jgi:hypothetical protein
LINGGQTDEQWLAGRKVNQQRVLALGNHSFTKDVIHTVVVSASELGFTRSCQVEVWANHGKLDFLTFIYIYTLW